MGVHNLREFVSVVDPIRGCPSNDLDFGNPSPPLMAKYRGDSRSLSISSVGATFMVPYGEGMGQTHNLEIEQIN